MSKLVLDTKGSKAITLEELDLIPLPPATESYTPVSHYQLVKTFKQIGQDILTDYALIGENYGVARDGNQLFAIINFKKDHGDMALSVAIRNSYDRSMSIGLAIGAQVFICSNLALCGEIAVMKKHTKNVWASLEDLAVTRMYRAQSSYDRVIADSEMLKRVAIGDSEAFRLMGYLFGHDIISPRQLTNVKSEWLRPSHPEFSGRDMWSFYNANTEALKSSPPLRIMENHTRLHEAITMIARGGKYEPA